jgi:hypothetical protein
MRFARMVEEAGPFFCEYERLWKTDYGDIVRNAAECEFPQRFQDAFGDLVDVWGSAVEVITIFYRAKLSDDVANERRQMRTIMDRGFEEGRPVLFERPRVVEPTTDGVSIDPQGYEREFFKCELIGAYLRACYGPLDGMKCLYTCRDAATGSVKYKDPNYPDRKWNALQFDTNYGGFFFRRPRDSSHNAATQNCGIEDALGSVDDSAFRAPEGVVSRCSASLRGCSN